MSAGGGKQAGYDPAAYAAHQAAYAEAGHVAARQQPVAPWPLGVPAAEGVNEIDDAELLEPDDEAHKP